MNTEQYFIREAEFKDFTSILDLYIQVSRNVGGLARIENEITEEYVRNFQEKSLQNGAQFVVVDKLQNDKIVAEIHCHKLEQQVFRHVLGQLTIAVHPEHQGKGLGKHLFKSMLDFVANYRNDIFRIELIARESNKKAINLYEKLGFQIEGRFIQRILTAENDFDADIPMAWFNPNFQLK